MIESFKTGVLNLIYGAAESTAEGAAGPSVR